MPVTTVEIDADTTRLEAALERCVELAERFREVWSDAPLPDAIERLDVSPGDTIVFRFEGAMSAEELARLKAEAEVLFPGVTVAILAGGVTIETVLRPEA